MGSVVESDLPLERLYRWERERPHAIYLTQPLGGGQVREWTWEQAAGEARRMAAYLRSQKWEPGSRVAILSKNCAWWILADLAIWIAGHVSVPVYPSLKAESVRQILEHSESKACFLGPTDERELSRLGIPAGAECICFPGTPAGDCQRWDEIMAGTTPLHDALHRPPQDLATVIYTSGTTGTPKGVMHSFGSITYNAQTMATLLGATAGERHISYLPLAHIVERVGIEVFSLFLGSHIYFTEGLETFVQDLTRARPTLFLAVPRILVKFQQNVFARVPENKLARLFRIPGVSRVVKRRILRQLGLDCVRHAACGAAPLPVEILLWFRSLGLNLVEGYGMTETLITHLPAPGALRPGYVGRAIAGVEARLGENGELQLRSPMNMIGYYKDPVGSRDCFLGDGYFRTGDLAEIAADGQLRIVGRIKEQFKTSKGKYVAPAPIESRLVEHPGVEACCLMGAGHPSPFAAVLLSEDVRRSCEDPRARAAVEESLRMRMEEVNAQLDPHERVAFLVVVDGPWTVGNGLLTPTLKLKRQLVEVRYHRFVEEWMRQRHPILWESAPSTTGAHQQSSSRA